MTGIVSYETNYTKYYIQGLTFHDFAVTADT